jgi:hypothetical protein
MPTSSSGPFRAILPLAELYRQRTVARLARTAEGGRTIRRNKPALAESPAAAE